jgi:hypothetical protein
VRGPNAPGSSELDVEVLQLRPQNGRSFTAGLQQVTRFAYVTVSLWIPLESVFPVRRICECSGGECQADERDAMHDLT